METKDETPLWKRLLLKLTSFKNIMALWAMVMISVIIFKNEAAFIDLCWGFLGLCGGDVIANIWQKRIEKK